MSFRFEFRPYARRFKEPLQTAIGQWQVREGFVLRMEDDDGTVGFGEVAPVPWFGTETLKIAETFLSSVRADGLPSKMPKGLPCCRFAISCCRSVMRQDFEPAVLFVVQANPSFDIKSLWWLALGIAHESARLLPAAKVFFLNNQ